MLSAAILSCCLLGQQQIGKIINPGQHPQVLVQGFKFTEGPVWSPNGELIWSDILGDSLYVLKQGKAEIFKKPSQRSIGNTFDNEGRLISCQQVTHSVVRYEKDGTTIVLADKFEGKRLNHPDDVIVRSDGTIYFTDPSFALSAADKALPFDGVYRISTDGKLTLLLKNYSRPNGLAFSPDEKRLYVNDTFRRLIFSYDVSPQGELSNEHLFAILTGDLAGLPNGMKTDIEGNVYCTGPGGIQVFQPDGKYMGLIYMKEVVSNFCFGDSDRKTLYITAGPSVFKLRVKIAGSKPPFH